MRSQTLSCLERVTRSSTQLTICLVRSVWMAVNRAWHTVGGPAGVGDADVNVKLHIKVNILLF